MGTHEQFRFRGVTVVVAADFVLSVFDDTTHALAYVPASGDPTFRGYAISCGYDVPGRDWQRYSRHHDLAHHWISDARGEVSPTLFAVAHGHNHPEAAVEEHRLNCMQRLWADRCAGIDWRDKEMTAAADALGPDWRTRIEPLFALLDRIP